jgi:hypothetical protein
MAEENALGGESVLYLAKTEKEKENTKQSARN